MSQKAVVELVKDQLIPAWLKERQRLDRIDRWLRWDCEDVLIRRQGATREIRDLVQKAKTPLLGLVVATLAQELLVESYRTTDPKQDDAPSWAWWLANRMPSRQYPLHHAAIGYGHAYTLVLPGEDELTGEPIPRIDGKSPRRMIAFYRDPEADEWAETAMEVNRQPGNQWFIDVYDEETLYRLTMGASKDGALPEFIDSEPHGMHVTPVVKYSTFVDLEGRSDGRVEPFIHVAGRAQKTMFDRLLVQHFNSWKIRTVAGMTLPDDEAEANRKKLKLSQEDFLVAASADTRFGTLDETSVEGLTGAYKQDVGTLGVVSQTPVHALTGDLINLAADAIKEARIGLEHLAMVSKAALGENHKQTLALASVAMGQSPDRDAKVGWADTDSRSMSQAADALNKLSTLHVPATMLWEEIPGWDQEKVERAKRLVEEGGDSIDQLIALLTAQSNGGGPPTPTPTPAPPAGTGSAGSA